MAYTTSVSVLPGTSTLALSLNDAAVGMAALGTPGRRQIATFSVAPGALAPGVNAVRLAVSQRHRVDCAPEATHELWTQLDPEATGYLPAGETPADPATLTEVGAARLDPGQPSAGKHRPQPAHGRLDFGKLGHRRLLG